MYLYYFRVKFYSIIIYWAIWVELNEADILRISILRKYTGITFGLLVARKSQCLLCCQSSINKATFCGLPI